jgi:Tfp pilus assembly protein PilV
MPDRDDDEFVSRKVIVEHSASSGTSRETIVAIVVIVVIALALIGYIVMHIHH